MSSACGRWRAAPAASSTRAFAVWWSCAAVGNGTITIGIPHAQSSLVPIIPPRTTARSAAAYASAMGERYGTTRTVGRSSAAYAAC